MIIVNPIELFSEIDPLEIPAGEILFKEGAKGDKMYVLLEGEMEISFRETVLEVARPGSLIGEMALIDQHPRSATVYALSDCKLSEISRKNFLSLIEEKPEFALHVMKVMVGRLRYMNALSTKP